jgi:hypothetical protein
VGEFATFLSTNSVALSAIGALAAFAWPVIQFFANKKREAEQRQFDAFHRLVKELVEPPEGKVLFIDRQAAIVFELRFFPRYGEFTVRMLSAFKIKLNGGLKEEPFLSRLIHEIDLTIHQIHYQRKNVLLQLFVRKPTI